MSANDRDFPDIPGQRGLATVAQLLERAWTPAALREARRTRFQEPMPRVVAPHRGPVDGATLLYARALWAGPKAVLSGGVALSFLGLTVRSVPAVTFVIPESSRTRRHGKVQLVRSGREIEVAKHTDVLRVANGARAVADAATYESHRPEDLEQWTISVLQRGLVTPEQMELELWMRTRAKVEAVWRGLGAFVDGAWSRPEGVLREQVERDGRFPPLLTNCELWTLDGEFVGLPDGYIEEAGAAIQVHSRQYHQGIDDQGGDRWAKTVERDSHYVAAGVRVVPVTPWTLYTKPRRFLNRLDKVVQLGLASPRPAIRVVRRDP